MTAERAARSTEYAECVEARSEMQMIVQRDDSRGKAKSQDGRSLGSPGSRGLEAIKAAGREDKVNDARKVSVGDIAEIPTSRGLAYAQCSHVHPMYAHLLRVLPRFYDRRPANLEIEICQKEAFLVFFPLQTAVNAGIFKIVGHCGVPGHVTEIPEFSTGLQDRVTKKVKEWWLWDGKRETRGGEIHDSRRGTRIPEVWSAPLLVENIERGWEARDEDSDESESGDAA